MHDALWVTGQLSSLRDPVVLAAFWGWGDTTGSALGALRYLRNAWQANEVATVDPDRFYDLSVTRPRRVVEPTARLRAGPAPGSMSRARIAPSATS